LEGNLIWEEGAIAIAESLKVNSTLNNLNLESNSIGVKGKAALDEARKSKSSMTIKT
jgi:hypothetical protein